MELWISLLMFPAMARHSPFLPCEVHQLGCRERAPRPGHEPSTSPRAGHLPGPGHLLSMRGGHGKTKKRREKRWEKSDPISTSLIVGGSMIFCTLQLMNSFRKSPRFSCFVHSAFPLLCARQATASMTTWRISLKPSPSDLGSSMLT